MGRIYVIDTAPPTSSIAPPVIDTARREKLNNHININSDLAPGVSYIRGSFAARQANNNLRKELRQERMPIQPVGVQARNTKNQLQQIPIGSNPRYRPLSPVGNPQHFRTHIHPANRPTYINR